MANKFSRIKLIIISLIVFLLLIVIFLSLTPTGAPRTSTDYIAEYNRINKPADFDPNNNAAPYFDKAFEVMAEEQNDMGTLQKLWPGDMNDWQIQMAKKWVESNRQTIVYLHQAIQKPYYWKPLDVNSSELLIGIVSADLNDIKEFREATYLLCLDSKLAAYDGNLESALNKSADIYKMGTFLTGSKLLIHQLVGIGQSTLAVHEVFQILEHTNPSSDLLEKFQKQLVLLSSNKPFLINYTSEKFMSLNSCDWLLAGHDQAKPSGNSFLFSLGKILIKVERFPWLIIEKYQANRLFNYMDSIRLKTPWQLHKEGVNLDDMAGRIVKVSILMRILTPAVSRALLYSYRCGVQTDALITTTAILRYKADKGHLPADLQTLVTDGFLDKLPMDPFSDGPLVYKLTNNDFLLYSVAQDFNDNGGKHDPRWAENGSGDYVFWPVQPAVSTQNPQQEKGKHQ